MTAQHVKLDFNQLKLYLIFSQIFDDGFFAFNYFVEVQVGNIINVMADAYYRHMKYHIALGESIINDWNDMIRWQMTVIKEFWECQFEYRSVVS